MDRAAAQAQQLRKARSDAQQRQAAAAVAAAAAAEGAAAEGAGGSAGSAACTMRGTAQLPFEQLSTAALVRTSSASPLPTHPQASAQRLSRL